MPNALEHTPSHENCNLGQDTSSSKMMSLPRRRITQNKIITKTDLTHDKGPEITGVVG